MVSHDFSLTLIAFAGIVGVQVSGGDGVGHNMSFQGSAQHLIIFWSLFAVECIDATYFGR